MQVTLDRVLEDNTLAELVTTGKLSGEAGSWLDHDSFCPLLPAWHCCRVWGGEAGQRIARRTHAPVLQGRVQGGGCVGLCVLPSARTPTRTCTLRLLCAELALLTLYLAYEKKRGKVGAGLLMRRACAPLHCKRLTGLQAEKPCWPTNCACEQLLTAS